MATRVQNKDGPQAFDLHFPLGGVDVLHSLEDQPPRQVSQDQYARTTPSAVNVRGNDPFALRFRGGSRPGLNRFMSVPLVQDWIVQETAVVVAVGIKAPGGNMQLSQSGRIVTLVAISQGNLFVVNAGDSAWTSPTNLTGSNPPLNFTGPIASATSNQKMWFADGVNWVYYDPNLNQILRWSPSAGALPVDGQGNTPRLICTWRGRTVLSGLLKDPQNWFMSEVNDPTNFDYAALGAPATMAIAGNNAPSGQIGDVVTSLIPWSDDKLIMGHDSSIYVFNGDPMAGGQIDCITRAIGITWGSPWCVDPLGNIYFFGSRPAIYLMAPGQLPQRISQNIDSLLLSVDTGANIIRMAWDDRYQGLDVFITPADQPRATTHYFWEQRSGAWWPTVYANKNHNPICCCVFDGNGLDDRVTVIGSWDGFVRTLDPKATDDDGTPIESEVILGPILTAGGDDMRVDDMQATMADDANETTFNVYVGESAQSALEADPTTTETLTAGRNHSSPVNRSGHAVYAKISGTKPWAVEAVRANVRTMGPIRKRGKH
jgi:hypothetical protein